MRGAHTFPGFKNVNTGIIPADAGSTRGSPTRRAATRDHPRGCGEHDDEITVAQKRAGSSPRMRGALGQWPYDLAVLGIIPADAGSTADLAERLGHERDHPRGCGEHGRFCPEQALAEGSSPRMRGAPFAAFAVFPTSGIIPADAGSTDWL